MGVVGHLRRGRRVKLRVLPMPPLLRQPPVLLVADVALEPVQVVGLTHVVDAPLPALQPFQQPQVGDLARRLELQVAGVCLVVAVQGQDELGQLPGAGEVTKKWV